MARLQLLLLGTAAFVMFGCGAEDQATAPPAPVPETERAELAFWTSGYDIGVSDDGGQHPDVVIGESAGTTVFPQLFSSVSWSPDGERIAFAGVEGEQTDEHDEPTDIYSIEPDDSGLQKITELGDAGGPLWAPSGETIVFTRTSFPEGGPLRGSLWSINLDDSELTQIGEADDWESFTAGSFTADGSELAVTRQAYDPTNGRITSEIELMSSDGSDRRSLIADGSDPAFSPDGQLIAFVSDREENGRLCYGDRCFLGNELYIANSDGSDPKRLTRTHALNERHPSWSPDASRLAYQRGEVFQNAEATSILRIDPDDNCEREILAGSGPGTWYANPAWRPSEPREGGELRC